MTDSQEVDGESGEITRENQSGLGPDRDELWRKLVFLGKSAGDERARRMLAEVQNAEMARSLDELRQQLADVTSSKAFRLGSALRSIYRFGRLKKGETVDTPPPKTSFPPRQSPANEVAHLELAPTHVFDPSDPPGGEDGAKALRYVAFYLPQFRRVDKNDANWGEGFTEWSNVFRGVPVFEGHKQPRLPRKDWLYSLETEEVLIRQSQLARAHGIDGFAHYLYWFDDEVLLSETPMQHANDNRVEIDFCFVWANENWTRKWDGRDEEIIVPQHYRDGYATRLAEHVAPFMKSGKYIHEDGRPLFIVYDPSKIPDLQQFSHDFRAEIVRAVGSNPYLVFAETFGFHAEPTSIGFDASVEFPPHVWPDEELRELRQHVSLSEVDARPFSWVASEEYLNL